jgi:hypothetical protein
MGRPAAPQEQVGRRGQGRERQQSAAHRRRAGEGNPSKHGGAVAPELHGMALACVAVVSFQPPFGSSFIWPSCCSTNNLQAASRRGRWGEEVSAAATANCAVDSCAGAGTQPAWLGFPAGSL